MKYPDLVLQVTVSIAAVLFLVCIVAIVFINQATQTEIFWESKKSELALITGKCRSDTEAWMEESVQLLNAMAEAFAQHPPENAEEYREQLAVYVRLDADIQAAYVGYESGEFHSDSGYGGDEEYKARGWYIEGLASDGSILFTEPYIDDITGELIVSLVKKVSSSSGDAGVAAMDISLAKLNSIIGGLSVSKNGGAYLVSAEGKVMTYIDPAFLPRIKDGEAVFLEADGVLSLVTVLEDVEGFDKEGVHVQHIIDYDGVEKYEAVTTIPEAGWTLGVNIPLSDYDDEVRAVVMAQWPLLVLAVIMSLICLYVALVVTSRERRRLKIQDRLMDELNEKNEQLSNLTNHDPLTGVFNRRYLIAHLGERLETYDPSRPASILMFDLDYFKKVNDQHGHGMGDEVLKATTAAMSELLRTNDILARLGGEEFIAVIDRAHVDQAYSVAERIRMRVSEMTFGEKVSITVSIGVAELHDGESVDSLLDRVDVCLYQAKESGRNCTVVDQPDRENH